MCKVLNGDSRFIEAKQNILKATEVYTAALVDMGTWIGIHQVAQGQSLQDGIENVSTQIRQVSTTQKMVSMQVNQMLLEPAGGQYLHHHGLTCNRERAQNAERSVRCLVVALYGCSSSAKSHIFAMSTC